MLRVNASTLRYWEKSIPQLNARRATSGQRYYLPEEVELFQRVCQLRHKEGFTMQGVKQTLDKDLKEEKEDCGFRQMILDELASIRRLLSSPAQEAGGQSK